MHVIVKVAELGDREAVAGRGQARQSDFQLRQSGMVGLEDCSVFKQSENASS